MDQTEERIIEEVGKYDHLYNFSSRDYKDCEMTLNSRREISQNTGLEVAECARRWPVESHVSRPKRKRDHLDDQLVKEITHLGERGIDLQLKLLEQADECSRFGQTVADLLRRVPEDKRPDVMFEVYGLIHENRL